jgi:hypothetical protein
MTTAQNITELTPALNRIMSQLRCFHAVTGRAPEGKMCANNYECGRCPYDQMLDDTVHVGRRMTEAVVRAA